MRVLSYLCSHIHPHHPSQANMCDACNNNDMVEWCATCKPDVLMLDIKAVFGLELVACCEFLKHSSVVLHIVAHYMTDLCLRSK